MKIAFVHDHPFYRKGDEVYSTGGMPSHVWSRYLINKDSLFVYGRNATENAKSLSSRDKVNFVLSKTYHKPTDLLKHYSSIKKELNEFLFDKDCVIARVPSILGNMSAEYAYKNNKPLLLEVVADAYDCYRHYGNFTGVLFAKIFDSWTKRLVKKSSYSLYVTQEYLQKRYPSFGKSIGCTNAVINSVDKSVIEKRIHRIESRTTNKFICGEIGDVSVRFKGCHVMLHAMKILKEKGVNIEFHMVGGGDPTDMQDLAKTLGIADNFYYRGFISHDKIPEFIDSLDVYVHPSFQEGLPRAVIEAISRGCPCATSNVAGTPELISNEYLHTPGNIQKLAADILKIISDKQREIDIVNANYSKGKEYYADIIAEKRKLFYNDFFHSIGYDGKTNI